MYVYISVEREFLHIHIYVESFYNIDTMSEDILRCCRCRALAICVCLFVSVSVSVCLSVSVAVYVCVCLYVCWVHTKNTVCFTVLHPLLS